MKKRTVLFIVFMFVVALFFSACSEKKTTEPEKQVAKPSFSPPVGTYITPQEVSISCATEDAIIKYTIDGTEPGENSLVYVSPIQIETNTTLIAKAFKSDWLVSEDVIAQYTLSVATPTFDPPEGTYTSAQIISINCSTEGTIIKYTTDGTEPNDNSLIFDSPIQIISNTILKAKAEKANCIESDVVIAEYLIEGISDIDGNVYQTIIIGDQEWMIQNLKVTHYRNGDPIPNVTPDNNWGWLLSGAYCYYDNIASNAEIYGALYNWYALDDSRGLAPEGWRVASDEDIMQLEMFLGMSESEASSIGWRGTNEGSKLAGGYDLWFGGSLRNDPEFDTSGFSFLPGGCRYQSGLFSYIGMFGYLWSSSDDSSTNAWCRHLTNGNTTVHRLDYHKKSGFSVRCVRDVE